MNQTPLCWRDYLILVDTKEETEDGRGFQPKKKKKWEGKENSKKISKNKIK